MGRMCMMENETSRRVFLKWLGATGGLLSLSPKLGIASELAKKKILPIHTRKNNKDLFLNKYGPIDYNIALLDDKNFLGDQPQLKAHPILWDKASFLETNKLPDPKEEVPLVIIGAGMSGLTSAYLLRKYKPIVLDQAVRLGGNAKGEVWNDLPYSVGAAYFMEQGPGSEIHKLFNEIGAHLICHIKDEEDPTLLNNKVFEKFWTGETDPAKKEQFLKLANYFKDVFNEKNGQKFPEMPLPISKFSEDKKGISYLTDLDKFNFRDFLEKKILNGEKLHPHIETALEHYCWSSLGSALNDLSAAAGLNFYAAEFGKVYVPPGGNSAVAECLLKKVLDVVPEKNLRTQSLVVDVVVKDNHTIVTYSDSNGVLHSIKAKATIMACPKFIVKHILRDIEPDRLASIEKLKYHGYLVANALIDQKIEKSFYDLYILEGGIDPEKSQITDVVSANYAPKKKYSSSVLSLYRGFPYDGGRAKMYEEESFKPFKEEMEKQLNEQIFPTLNIKKESIKSLRITRWGHPIPVASPGLISDGTLEKIRQPFKKRVFFVEQDNWMLPAIETAVGEALFWSHEVKKVLG